MNLYPYIYQFVTNAYFEEDKNIISDIACEKNELIALQKKKALVRVDRSMFKHPNDLEVLYDMVLNMSEGYIVNKLRTKNFQITKIRDEVILMMENLQRNYYKN